MGRQILFYMLPTDRTEFLNFVTESYDVVICARDAQSKNVEALDIDRIEAGVTLCLWNRRFLPNLERQWIPDPGYFRIGTLNEPVLEYMSSFSTTWKQQQALGQGRLFGNFEPYLGKPGEFVQWYEVLARWIRKQYRKNPSQIGGYIGPDAQKFAKGGGYLLPNFLPAETADWETIVTRP